MCVFVGGHVWVLVSNGIYQLRPLRIRECMWFDIYFNIPPNFSLLVDYQLSQAHSVLRPNWSPLFAFLSLFSTCHHVKALHAAKALCTSLIILGVDLSTS